MRALVLDTVDVNINRIGTVFGKEYPNWNLHIYQTAFEFVTAVYDQFKGDTDLAFIHIKGCGDKNIDMARELQEFFPQLQVVFYSETENCAEDIFRANPLFFIKLPFNAQNIKNAMHRVLTDLHADSKQALTISTRGLLRRIRFHKIHYIESEGRKLILYTDDGGYEANLTVDAVMEELPDNFHRCHRSYIVNMDRVIQIAEGMLFLSTGEVIPVSRNRLKELQNRF